MSPIRHTTPVLIIGSGIAGCTTALALADLGAECTLITTGDTLDNGNSPLAQGGIVYKAPDENPDQLAQDILTAGHNFNYSSAVRHLCNNGPKAVEDILVHRLNIPFAKKEANAEGEWDLTREGGHCEPRILHCADYTGRAIMDGLVEAVQAHKKITVLTNRTAVDLLTSHHHSTDLEYRYQLNNQCAGAYVFNELEERVETIIADFTVLATGGVGQVYLHTTNTSSSIGSGLAMAHRAGARTHNAEFVQFHPTALFHRSDRRFLITEAMRGEGARLVNNVDEAFMPNYDSRADLAPRDIVARSIVEEMFRTDHDCVYLDTSQMKHNLATRFPTIYNRCKKLGIDIRNDAIPVVPAAHYFCGGILADANGRTTVERLYSVGECNCTGVHGANRLASTSLLEALLWGKSAAHDISARINSMPIGIQLKRTIADWETTGTEHNDDPALIAQDWSRIRNTMWNYVGITRSKSRLSRAFEDMRDLSRHVHDFYKRTPLSKRLIDLFHGCQAAYIITLAAKRNQNSLGCHYRVD